MEFENEAYPAFNLHTSLSTVSLKMLQALPWYTYIIMAGINFSVSFAPYIETAIWSSTKVGRNFVAYNYLVSGNKGLVALSSKARSPLSKAMQGVSIALIALDLGLNIYDSIQKDYTFAQGAISFTLTAAKDIGLFFLTAELSKHIGAAIGSSGGPVGMFIGYIIGFAIGFVIDIALTALINWFVGLFGKEKK